YSSRRAMNAQLMFDAYTLNIITRRQSTLVIHQIFRHDEKTEALYPARRTFHARQHQMDDVLRKVVFAIRDENFGAEQSIASIGLPFSTATHLCQVRTSMRFSQIHGARPFPRHQLFQEIGRASCRERV